MPPTDAPFDPFPALETERLRLRELTGDDAPALLAIYSDPDVTRYYDLDTFTGLADATDLLRDRAERLAAGRAIRWGLESKTGGGLVGDAGLWDVTRRHGFAELAYVVSREHWGRGLATEAAGAVVAFAFETLGLHRIEARVDPDNSASRRVLEKLGLRYEALHRERYRDAGLYRDEEVWALLRSE